ncbi:MAG: hypothetical protein ACFB2X_07025 [Rivularia sp. (in: cyanobacteria)]
MSQQKFIDSNSQQWEKLPSFPGVEIFPLAQPVSQDSIHKLPMTAGTEIPVNFHPFASSNYS